MHPTEGPLPARTRSAQASSPVPVGSASGERVSGQAVGERKLWRAAVAVLAGAALLRLLMSAAVPLFPDETYYWMWSRHLAASYFDHPAGIALTIRLGTLALGATRMGVRLFIVLSGFGASLAVAATARRLAGDRAALRAAWVLACMPLAGAGLLLATPDVPLLLTGSWCLYFVIRALEHPAGSRLSWRWWIAAGVALGLAMDSKYTAVILPLGVLVALLVVKRLRPRMARPEPYVAGALALILFLPTVLWNAHHGWVSFAFQLHHGLGTPTGNPFNREAALLGGQLGLASPILFVMMVIAAVVVLRRRRSISGDAGGDDGTDASRRLLGVVTLVALGFFVLSALRRPVEANWPAPAYIAATAVLAAYTGGRRWRAWLRGGLALGAAMVALVYVQALYPVLPVPPPRDPVARAFGYDAVAEAVQTSRRTAEREGVGGRIWLSADSYETASELTFHLPGHPLVFSVNVLGRPNQFDLWPDFPARAQPGDALLLVTGCGRAGSALVDRLSPHFHDVTAVERVARRRRRGEIAERCVNVLRGWDGGWPSR